MNEPSTETAKLAESDQQPEPPTTTPALPTRILFAVSCLHCGFTSELHAATVSAAVNKCAGPHREDCRETSACRGGSEFLDAVEK